MKVTVLGSGAWGTALALLLLAKNATVTVCHTRTKDLPAECRAADVLEDLDYYCVDNMPIALMPRFAELCIATGGRYEKVALVTDVRAKNSFNELISTIDQLKESFSAEQLDYFKHRAQVTKALDMLWENAKVTEVAAKSEKEAKPAKKPAAKKTSTKKTTKKEEAAE